MAEDHGGARPDPRAIERRLWQRVVLANLLCVVPNAVFVAAIASTLPHEASFAVIPVSLAAVGVFFLAGAAGMRPQVRMAFRDTAAWLEAGRPPTEAEAREALRLSGRLAMLSLPWWIAALVGVLVMAHFFYTPLGGWGTVASVAGLLHAGLVVCAIAYLFVERALRPVFAAAMEGRVPERSRAASILVRLALQWVIGSGIYLVAIVALVTSLPAEDVGRYVLLACTFGAVTGFTLAILAAQTVSEPMVELRAAIRRVELGDLAASVSVDDAGEVGQVQAGFNQMVAGLRERERIRDLFARHVGDGVAQRAVGSEGPTGVTEREVTILFVDMIGSTALATQVEPGALVDLLNAMFVEVVRSVGDEGGLVNSFHGDGALCLFGAPNPLEDHAAAALRVASTLHRCLGEIRERDPRFDAAMGVSTGPVVVGEVGPPERYVYTVIGDAANEASRLADLAKQHPSRVLVSGTTIAAAGGASGQVPDGWAAEGDVVVRGRSTPSATFSLLASG